MRITKLRRVFYCVVTADRVSALLACSFTFIFHTFLDIKSKLACILCQCIYKISQACTCYRLSRYWIIHLKTANFNQTYKQVKRDNYEFWVFYDIKLKAIQISIWAMGSGDGHFPLIKVETNLQITSLLVTAICFDNNCTSSLSVNWQVKQTCVQQLSWR